MMIDKPRLIPVARAASMLGKPLDQFITGALAADLGYPFGFEIAGEVYVLADEMPSACLIAVGMSRIQSEMP